MSKSIWLERYENEMKNMQKEQTPKRKVMLIIIPIMFLGMLALALKNGSGGHPEVNIAPYLIGLGVIFLLIFVMTAFLSKRTVTKDMAKRERENLNELLVTPQQVQEFDAEMTSQPLCEIQTDSTEYVLFTGHYLVSKYQICGWPHYSFARLSDIARNDFAISRDQNKVHGMGKLYLVDLLDANGKKLIGINVAGKKKMEEFEELLTKYCLGIQLKEHTLF